MIIKFSLSTFSLTRDILSTERIKHLQVDTKAKIFQEGKEMIYLSRMMHIKDADFN